jgi:hypothetical protein
MWPPTVVTAMRSVGPGGPCGCKAFELAVYASQWVCPRPAQDSLPAAGQALPGGLSTRRVPRKGFRASSYIVPGIGSG